MGARAAAALLLCLLVWPLILSAPPAGAESPAQARQELRRRMQKLLGERQELLTRQKRVQDELDRIQQELAAGRQRARQLEQEKQRTARELAQVKRRIAELTPRVQQLRQRYHHRLRALYLFGPDASQALWATAADFQQALASRQALTLVLAHDHQRLQHLRRQVGRLAALQKGLEDKERQLERLSRQLVRLRGDLLALKERKQALAAELKRRGEQVQQNLAALQEAEARLARTFALGPPSGRPAQPPTGGVLAVRGGLSPPVEGRLTGRSGPGVVLKARPEAPVRAPWWGKVAFAGPLAGYGLVAVIDHGQRVHTVLAHLGSLAVVTGQEVQAGQVLGSVDRTGRLYLEVRQGAKPQNPLRWLRLTP